MDKRKIIYYEDELNDEFSIAQITPKYIGEDYVYCYESGFKKLTHFFWYRIVAMPVAFLYTKLVFGHKIIGGEKLKESGKTGYFLYGNHTQDIADAFIPNMLDKNKDKYIIVHPNNVSIPVIGKVTPSLGALPLPDDRSAYSNFIKAIERRVGEKKVIVIYPEAHIWPYYTGIRNFKDDSFHYPIKYNAPVYCFTNTYHKRRLGRRPKIVTYVDGPFLADETIPLRERRKELRDRVYKAMCERATLSDFEQIKYIKKEK